MAEEKEEKKSIFDRMIDMVTTRDEKQAVEDTQKDVEEAKLQATAAQAAANRAQKADAREKAALEKQLQEASERAAAAEAKARDLETKMSAQRMQEAKARDIERQERMAAMRTEAAKPKIITEHTLTSKETLSHLALKYYGHATKPYWMVIYEANKDVVGENPNLVHKGMVIKIPELPSELKDKD